MKSIEVKRNPSREELEALNVFNWPVWEKEISEFPWTYDEQETCYFLEGQVTVITESGESVTVGAGDLVTFPKNLKCTWKIRRPVKKHYHFG